MAWTIEITDRARKQIAEMDLAESRKIARFVKERLSTMDDPRELGAALQGSELGHYWRYRVGDYRLICELQDHHLIIVLVSVGHRRQIYRWQAHPAIFAGD